MSVHKKLMQARIQLQNTKLSKSGHNKFAGYQYFELGDFLPKINEIFNELGLAGIVSFTAETSSLTITDTETGKEIVITSPMAQASLKGCHEVQNLGASQTYLRRYLWVTAMEIVEHDALDATTGQETKGKGVHKPTDNQDFQPDEEERKFLQSIVDTILGLDTDFEASVTYLGTQTLDADEKTYVWNLLPSNIRSGIKKAGQSKKETA